ncbi:twin-arginine translocase TatA/TatE family subunit [Georgenia sp. H159]|uniref:twin-arginine translocase TatA/TatE family subunit n=1 Tax=Georgenia sp. H159 TaxID=3076115 RepID=UPI002D78F25C|nr:twin-arginine translocase TatA/TatE family subunit [Georgenia sp. H159]
MPINGSELAVIALLAIVLIGPERLPQYAEQLGRLVRNLRRLSTDTSERVRAELGPELDDLDLKSLDPRQYDPRRIVRDALREEPGTRPRSAPRAPAGRAPFDDEAT